jgi:predicted GNAT family acetyltransferase
MSLDIVRSSDPSRFEATVEGHLCVLDYRLEGSTVFMTHVGVPPPVEGRGIAGELTQTAVAWARAEGLEIVAACPYVAAWMGRHPEA